MVATATLAADTSAHFAYALMVEGLPYFWVTHTDLTGTSWIGAADGRSGKLGLLIDGMTLELAIDLARTSMLDANPVTFELADHDSTFVSMMGSFDGSEAPLDTTLDPGDAGTAVKSKHVGTEFVNGTGVRASYPWYPAYQIGKQHIGKEYEHPDLPPAPVSDSPILFAGRRCGLYRVYRDHHTYPPARRSSTDYTQWNSWANSDLIWWGTLRDAGSVDGKVWTIEADGPESLLQKPLGVLTQDYATTCEAQVSLNTDAGADESRIGIYFYSTGGDTEYYGEDAFSSTFTAGDTVTLVGELKIAIASALTDVGPDGDYKSPNSTEFIGAATMDASSREISIKIGEDPFGAGWSPSEREGHMHIILHETQWKRLGYDPPVQKNATEPGYVVKFVQVAEVEFPDAGPTQCPGPGYWRAHFQTVNWEDPQDVTNSGAPKVYKPIFPGGVAVLTKDLNGGKGQVVKLGGQNPVVIATGQLDRPPFSSPTDKTAAYTLPTAGAVTRQGLWVFTGKWRPDLQSEPTDRIQVGRCSWREGAGAQAPQVKDGELVIHEWHNPSVYGMPGQMPTTDWAADSDQAGEFAVMAQPMLTLGYKGSYWRSQAHVVLQRLMLCTGTSTGWSSFSKDPTAVLDAGDNEPAAAALFIVRRDGEIADLGLAIPEALVQSPVTWGIEADKLDIGLRQIMPTFMGGGVNSYDVIQGIIQPLGWCMSLRGGQYGVFSPWETVSPDDVDATITITSKATGFDRPMRTRQEIRAFQPIDKFTLNYHYNPIDGKHTRSVTVKSTDRGARYRTGGVEVTYNSFGHRGLLTSAWGKRVGEISRWWEKRHFWLRDYPLKRRTPGRDIWPGSRVLITEERVANPDGTYGVTNYVGIVTRTREDLGFDGEVVKRCDILVQADSAAGAIPRHGPIAQTLWYDSANSRIYCKDDMLGIGDGSSDVSRFVIGANMSGTGNAGCEILQWDFNGAPSVTCTFDVTGYNDDTSGDHYVTITNFSGTYYRDMPGRMVFQDYDSQGASWVTTNYGAVGNSSGQTPGGTAVSKWVT